MVQTVLTISKIRVGDILKSMFFIKTDRRHILFIDIKPDSFHFFQLCKRKDIPHNGVPHMVPLPGWMNCQRVNDIDFIVREVTVPIHRFVRSLRPVPQNKGTRNVTALFHNIECILPDTFLRFLSDRIDPLSPPLRSIFVQ